ncbi:hypothetical protein Q4595_03580 [Wenyingzhuangia sp. 1_MG-2023]|nr:hypothetical protein [Wenyingzhuangia sp. 1_MG-2023]
MKLKFLFLITSFILFSCSSGDENSLSDNSILRTVTYTNATKNEAYIYDNSGLLIRTLLNGSINESYESVDGRIVKKTRGNNSYTYEYNTDGQLIKRSDFENDEYLQFYIEFTYDNNKVTAIRKDETGGVFDQKTEFLLDSNGRVTSKKELDNNGDALSEEVFNYNSSGNIVKVTNINSVSSTSTTTTYEYLSIKNPYYTSFRETYNSIYLDVFYSGHSILNSSGFSVYLLKNDFISYKSNNNFPTESNNSESEEKIKFNYY